MSKNEYHTRKNLQLLFLVNIILYFSFSSGRRISQEFMASLMLIESLLYSTNKSIAWEKLTGADVFYSYSTTLSSNAEKCSNFASKHIHKVFSLPLQE